MWLVKSARLHIQALYVPDKTLEEKNMFVGAVAIGGLALRRHRLVAGSLGDEVTWDGVPIFARAASRDSDSQAFLAVPSRFEVAGLLSARQTDWGLVTVGTSANVTMSVTRKQRHVNVVITMPPQDGGQDGLCGNFNGIAGDDSLELAETRHDPKVEPSASLFEGLGSRNDPSSERPRLGVVGSVRVS